jgi:hypothetical protein
LFFIPFLTP